MTALSVLVVEDDEALRTLFEALLTRKGFQLECVNDGAQGLRRLGERSFDVILLDLMMPVCNGFDVLQALAERGSGLLKQIIVTTGVSERELSKLDRDRVFAVLRKPFDIDVLVSTILECAAQRRTAHPAAKLDGVVARFESDLPRLRGTLAPSTAGARELLLREQLRSAVGKLGRILAAAAKLQREPDRAARYTRTARHAATLSTTHGRTSRREH